MSMEPDKFDGVATHYYKHTSFCDGFWDVLVCPVTLSLSLSLSNDRRGHTHTRQEKTHTHTAQQIHANIFFIKISLLRITHINAMGWITLSWFQILKKHVSRYWLCICSETSSKSTSANFFKTTCMKISSVSWDVITCALVKYWHFWGTCYPCVQKKWSSSKMLVLIYHTAWHQIPSDINLQSAEWQYPIHTHTHV